MANNSTFLCSDESSTMDDVEETRKGPWTYEEDMRLINYISFYGDGRWDALAKASGLKRTGKSCRLRWVNYLRPDLKRSRITPEEERLIIDLHRRLGNRWSRIAQCLPGRTDNEIKNFYRTHIKKKDSNSSSRVCRSGGGCIEDMETRALAFKKVCVDRDNAVAEHVKKKSLRFEEEDSEDPGVDTELKLCPQEIRSRETASSLADDSSVSLSCNTAGHNLQDPEEEQQQRLKHNLHSHAHTHSHAHSHTHADADSRVHYQSFVGSLTAIMSDFYNDGFHHYEPVAVDTVSCSLEENSSDDETFVDYSDELWNINSAGRPRIRKSEDH